jgi:AraC family transcriptional regulator
VTLTADLPASPPLDRILHRSAVVEIGQFRVRPDDPRFHDSGPIERHIAVFPRTSVWITHEGGPPFVASPEVVTFYNRGQVYRRDSVRGLPDRCEWFAFAPSLIAETIAEFEPDGAERLDRPFPFAAGPGDSRSYLEQRRVVESLRAVEAPDPLEIDETMVRVFTRVVSAAYRAREAAAARDFAGGGRAARRDRDLAQHTREELARALGSPVKLADIAGRLGTSPFRLCRVFRKETGSTIHAYRTRLRLAAALEILRQSSRSLTEIALGLGFSSHSHFTAAFRREYGLTPSALRRSRSLLEIPLPPAPARPGA